MNGSDRRTLQPEPPGHGVCALPHALPSGVRLQEFELTGVIGHGGFGIVYGARDCALERLVAIKEFMPAQLAYRDAQRRIQPVSDAAAQTFRLGLQSFLKEAQLLASLKHPALVEVHRFWEENGTAYLVMPLYRGITLERWVHDRPHGADAQWVASLVEPLLGALEHIHAAGCCHRDVSPENILILENGAPILLDLGAARRVLGAGARTLTVMLKPSYAPLEQYADDPGLWQGPWTDLYALACVLYFAITGKAPPAAATRLMHDTVVPLATLQPKGGPAGLLRAIDAAMSVRPEARPQSVAEFRRLLDTPAAPREVSPVERCMQAAQSMLPWLGPSAADGAATRAASTRSRIHPAALAGLAAATVAAFLLRSEPGDPSPGAANPVLPAAVAPTVPRAEALPEVHASAAAVPIPEPIPEPAVALPATEPQSATADRATTARETPSAAEDPATTALVGASDIEALPLGPWEPPRFESVQAVAASAGDAEPAVAAAVPAPPPVSDATMQAQLPPTAMLATATDAPSPIASAARAAPIRTSVQLRVRPWAEVYVDGVARGVTPPLKELALPPGKHVIEFRNPGAPSKRLEIDVAADAPLIVSHRF